MLQQAHIDRRQGLNNLRQYLAWRGQGPDGTDGKPFDAWSKEAVQSEMDAHRKSKRRLGGKSIVPWTGI